MCVFPFGAPWSVNLQARLGLTHAEPELLAVHCCADETFSSNRCFVYTLVSNQLLSDTFSFFLSLSINTILLNTFCGILSFSNPCLLSPIKILY